MTCHCHNYNIQNGDARQGEKKSCDDDADNPPQAFSKNRPPKLSSADDRPPEPSSAGDRRAPKPLIMNAGDVKPPKPFSVGDRPPKPPKPLGVGDRPPKLR